MRYLLLIAIALCPLFSHAQSWQWVTATGGDKQAGAIRRNQGAGICTDENGNVYVAGFFAGKGIYGKDTLNTYSNTDPLLVKYDSSGKIVWARKLTNGTADYCYGICLDRAQNVCVTGIESGHIISAFTAKYDSRGNLVWMNETKGEDCASTARAIVSDPVGNIYMAGDSKGAIDLDNFTIGADAKYTLFLVKYDVKGRVLWVKQSAPSENYFTQVHALAIDAEEHLYIAGTFVNELQLDSIQLKGTGEQDIFIARFSRYGKVEWARSWGSRRADVPRSLAIDDNGNIYLTAFFTDEYKAKGKTLIGENLIKFSPAGELVWNTQIGLAEHDYSIASFVALDKDGSPCLTGNTYGAIPLFGDKHLYCSGESDIFVAKCSADGVLQWKLQEGGSGVDEGDAICVDAASNIYVTGYFHNRVDFGKFPVLSPSGDDGIWVGKLKAGK